MMGALKSSDVSALSPISSSELLGLQALPCGSSPVTHDQWRKARLCGFVLAPLKKDRPPLALMLSHLSKSSELFGYSRYLPHLSDLQHKGGSSKGTDVQPVSAAVWES